MFSLEMIPFGSSFVNTVILYNEALLYKTMCPKVLLLLKNYIYLHI